VRNDIFRNWAGRFRYRPRHFVQPASEKEIVELVKNSKSLRVFGSGHSFNGGLLVDETLVSLDNYSGVIWRDLEKKQLAVKAGCDGLQFDGNAGLRSSMIKPFGQADPKGGPNRHGQREAFSDIFLPIFADGHVLGSPCF
jgi:FAD/FMN-containing dehydrogenase